MAFTDGLSFTQNIDITSGVVSDTSNYGSPNPLRSDRANYLLWSKTDQNGNRVFTNPDPGDVLATLDYTVTTLVDGYYEGILLRVAPYNNGSSYVEEQSSGSTITQYASIVYYSGGVYKCTAPSTGNLPTNGAFWTLLSDLTELIVNPNVQVFIQDFYIKVRSIACIGDLRKPCNCSGSEGNKPFLTLYSKLIGADAEFANGNPEEMDKIIREIEASCPNCQ